ncbi:hypothetical protein ACX0HA_02315 [Flavobacterium hauense]
MKKLIHILLLAFIMLPNLMQGQENAGAPTKIWSYPVIYNYDEEVTWYFDLSSTTFAETEDIYLWIWSPSEPDAGNWENSSDFAKLTYVGNKVWSFKLTPTVYFTKTPDEIAASAGFWFRLKSKTGNIQSDVANVPYTPFADFATANELFRAYPPAPTLTGGLSILFNANLQPGFEDATSVHMHSGLNNWDLQQQYQAENPEVAEKTKLKNLGGGIYKMDLIPSVYFNAPEGYIMQNMNFLFVKDGWAGNTPDQVINAAEYIPPPPPKFMFFPTQISKRDFLGMIRTNNETDVNKLIYTITAGDHVITGEFSGGVSEIKGFVNLVSELQNVNVSVIHVLVKDNKGKVISDSDITLKTLD